MTLFGLADQIGISHNEARRIAADLRPCLQHAHKASGLSRYEEAQLRPLFLKAKTSPHPTMALAEIPRPEPMLPGFETPTMTVKQVAEALGVDRSTITRWTAKFFPELTRNGETTLLDEEQVTRIKQAIGTGRNDLCNIAQVKNIHTELEMIEKTRDVLLYLTAKVEEQREALAIAAPKVESFDRFIDSSGSICLMDAAKQLGQSPRKFFDDLHALGVLFRRGRDWVPYQLHIDRGWFVVKSLSFGEGEAKHMKEQTRVTPRGIDGLAKMFPTSGQVSA